MSLEINKSYNFSLYAPSVLGAQKMNAKLIGILDYSSAIKLKNIEQLHRMVYPSLPSGTPSDLTKYLYYNFLVNNESIVLASHWIIPSSIVEVTSINLIVDIYNVQTSDIEIIRKQLSLLGMNFTIKIV